MNKEKTIEDFTEEELNQIAIGCVSALKLRNERNQLKQALNEIREYLLSNVDDESADFEALDVKYDVLQIIDKF